MNLVCAPILAGNSYGDQVGDQVGDESKLVVQAHTNLGSGGPDDNEAQAGHLVVAQCHGSNVGPMGHLRSGNGTVTGGVPFVAHSINAHSGGVQVEATYLPIAGVRRLTPTECERLQGFPDLWTCLCAASAGRDWSVLRLPDEAVNRCTCPDGPRYKALGNAVTLGVIKWLGKRLAREVCA